MSFNIKILKCNLEPNCNKIQFTIRYLKKIVKLITLTMDLVTKYEVGWYKTMIE